MSFLDRRDAGERLAAALARFRAENPVVLALPRGGIEVAHPVAVALDARLDVLCVRKVGAPGHEELGLGAVAEGGFVYLDRDLVAMLGVDDADLETRVARKKGEVEERVRMFRGGQPLAGIEGRTVIVVDDGIATGGTVAAALEALRALHPKRIVLAVPVAAPTSLRRLAPLADETVVLEEPEELWAIGAWYEDFSQVTDDRVVELLAERAREREKARGGEQESLPLR